MRLARRHKQVADTQTRPYDGENLIEETDSTGVVVTHHAPQLCELLQRSHTKLQRKPALILQDLFLRLPVTAHVCVDTVHQANSKTVLKHWKHWRRCARVVYWVGLLNLPALFTLADFHVFSVIYGALSCTHHECTKTASFQRLISASQSVTGHHTILSPL